MNDLIEYNPSVELAEQTYNYVAKMEDIRDLYKLQIAAAAARELAKQAKEPKAHWNHFMAIAIWARWKIGKIIPEQFPHGGDHKSSHHNGDLKLKDIGIEPKHESNRWQLLARVDKDKLQDHINQYNPKPTGKPATLTFNGCYKLLPKPPAPEGTYDVIVVDPPWEVKKISRDDRPNQEDMDYPIMSIDELIRWGPEYLKPASDCHLFLWTTHKYLHTGFHLLTEWGFKYVCTFVWHKPGGFQPVGLPQYNCEFILYGHKGSPRFISTKGLKTCFEGKRGEHSKKPDEFFEMIKNATEGNRLSMFERYERNGFEGWGDEYDGMGK